MGLRVRLHTFILLSSSLLLTACGNPFDTEKGTSVSSEKAYCASTSYSNAATVSGSATFTAWSVTTSGLVGTTTNSIKYAEVEVHDSSGTIIQCGETDSSGNFALQVPKENSQLTVKVNSRANNNYLKASVLNNITDNVPYSISASVNITTSSTTVSTGVINASQTGTLEGGAFNILEQVLKANNYIRTNSTTANCPVCGAFTVAPKVSIYWAPGFNPYTYVGGPATSGLSFYSKSSDPNERKLFILGGINGNVSSADTDHFDNSVILHEYGHFLEDAYAGSDSPGGSHNGNFIVDPRLAWSEGWANFFQAAVLGAANYRDSVGNQEGTTSLSINFNLEEQTTDVPATNGEGTFREISISRVLWDTIETSATSTDSRHANISFAYLWYAFTDSTVGLSKTNVRFRNIGRFNEIISSLVSNYENGKAAQFNTVLSNEKQNSNRIDYAYVVSKTGATCSATSIQAVADSISFLESPPRYVSNLHKSNDFYEYYHSGGALNLSMTYTQGGSPSSDLDLYIYKDGYLYEDSASLIGSSDKSYGSEENGSETVSVNAPAGYYLINVRVYTAGKSSGQIGGPANYTLYSSGVQLCP